MDLRIKYSIGAISSMEYKRRAILNELNYMSYSSGRFSLPTMYPTNINDRIRPTRLILDTILGMEVDPREGKRLLVLSKYHNVTLFNVSEVQFFHHIKRVPIPLDPKSNTISPNSVHWLWDGSVFSVCHFDSVHFWDSNTCKIIETVKLRTKVLNHIIAAKKNSTHKYVAVSGATGHVFIIDMLHGIVVMTMNNIEKSAIRTIQWHPTNEKQYVTGNDSGNIFLWDIRYQMKYVLKFQRDNSGLISSLDKAALGLRFYNCGNNIISVDYKGSIKTWDVNTGKLRPNHYASVSLSDLNTSHLHKHYQFDVTDNLKEDIAFFPSTRGMRIFDIESGEHLPSSNDVGLSLSCANYDPKNLCLYGSSNESIKSWKPQKCENNIHFEYPSQFDVY
ncbi:DNA excision repair protein ERCC-8-like isoform X2 [Aphis gossypii]|nr:DNA excision repair protein ERCC-8-like isoform X2 [Aphis gossypii]XP_027850806.1 DNA excision repair protein ERCC-8-like isoform X2 [Aphis gossypii]XP_027850807.1 DNA excision repair protein ERCC-8-like isoform X2 [Aphis gossypii]XP_027850808.1 DNA excision repair protein ERCC-8-like isoform X2 [Aphis gossypii]